MRASFSRSSVRRARAHGVIADDVQEADVVFRIVERATEKGFGEALNRGERRFELVGNVRDEILSDALKAAEFGDVMQHDDGAGDARRSGGAGGSMARTGVALTEKY